MRRRESLKSAAASGVAAEGLQSASAERPNFLSLIADDLTFRAIHALNNPEVRAPHMDSLANRTARSRTAFIKAPGSRRFV
jgi:choline-sulfatase